MVPNDAGSFWALVTIGSKDECWPFRGYINSRGYGVLRVAGRRWRAHRFAFFLANGRRPKQVVMHKCDNPICCNPSHLGDGTHMDNVMDKVSKKRHANQWYRGEGLLSGCRS